MGPWHTLVVRGVLPDVGSRRKNATIVHNSSMSFQRKKFFFLISIKYGYVKHWTINLMHSTEEYTSVKTIIDLHKAKNSHRCENRLWVTCKEFSCQKENIKLYRNTHYHNCTWNNMLGWWSTNGIWSWEPLICLLLVTKHKLTRWE